MLERGAKKYLKSKAMLNRNSMKKGDGPSGQVIFLEGGCNNLSTFHHYDCQNNF